MNKTNKNSTLLILGNGFDLDLGRGISFKDFYDSPLWPKRKNCSLKRYIEMWGATDNWFDLEHYLDLYCDANNSFVPDDMTNDSAFFSQLKQNLEKYVEKKSNAKVRCIKRAKGKCQSPVSYQLLKEVIKKGGVSVYSFNYTSLHQHWSKMTEDETLKSNPGLFANFDDNLHYVHGSLRDKDIVIGATGATPDARNGYSFMKKSTMIAVPSGIKDELCHAETVIIFGHSLSEVDYCYFKDFFDGIKKGQGIVKDLIVVTNNANSMNKIKNNLLAIDKSNFALFDRMEFYFTDSISTSLRKNNSSPKLNKLLSYI